MLNLKKFPANNSKVLLAGNLNFKFRIVFWNIFWEIWRFEKPIALSERKPPLGKVWILDSSDFEVSRMSRLQYWAWCPGPMIPTTRKAQGNMSYLACMSSFFAWVIWLFFFSNVAENQPFGGLQSMKEWQRARLPFTLLGSGSEWPKDQTLFLTMVSYLSKKIKIKREKRKEKREKQIQNCP